MNLYEMKLGDSVWVSEFESNVLRVPGGWLFRTADGERDSYTSSTFVPFNNEFMKPLDQGESPATTGNIDYTTALHEEVCRWSDDINLHPLTNEMIVPLLERVKHLNATFKAPRHCA